MAGLLCVASETPVRPRPPTGACPGSAGSWGLSGSWEPSVGCSTRRGDSRAASEKAGAVPWPTSTPEPRGRTPALRPPARGRCAEAAGFDGTSRAPRPRGAAQPAQVSPASAQSARPGCLQPRFLAEAALWSGAGSAGEGDRRRSQGRSWSSADGHGHPRWGEPGCSLLPPQVPSGTERGGPPGDRTPPFPSGAAGGQAQGRRAAPHQGLLALPSPSPSPRPFSRPSWFFWVAFQIDHTPVPIPGCPLGTQ